MNDFKLLLIEDNEGDIDTCYSSVERYNHEHNKNIELKICKSLTKALETLDSTYDGVIIDLQLGAEKDGGNQITKRLIKDNYRTPFAIFTATPDAVESEYQYIGTFKKGEETYDNLFDKFWEIHETGLTRIMGGRGKIEKALNEVFINNILPHRSPWIEYAKEDSEKTEKSLLRHTINHLLQLIDDDQDAFFPEEVYIHPKQTTEIKPGEIVRKKEDNSFHIILNPACDLAVRSGGCFKTDQILIVEIEDEVSVTTDATNQINKPDRKTKKLQELFKNNHTNYYHWLPRTDFFDGGFLNFRRLCSTNIESYSGQFEPTKTQVSPPFLKDVLGRFSAYYARQGQPAIDTSKAIKQILNQTQETSS